MADYLSVPMRATAPAGSPARYSDPKTIDNLLKSSDPEAVAEAGRSYQKFASAYEKIAQELSAMRVDLHDAWGGQDAAAAQAQLREVWAAATVVHKTADSFGVAVERHGSESLAWYKNNKPPSKDLNEARSWMTGANERVTQSWSALPPDLSTTLPPGGEKYDEGSPSTGSPSTGSPGVDGGSSGTSSSSGGSSSLSQFPDGSKTPAGDMGPGTQLAGATPPVGGAYGPGSGWPDVATSGLNPGGGSMPGGGPNAGPGLIGPGGVLPGGMGMGPAATDGVGAGRRVQGLADSAAAEEVSALEAGAAGRPGTTGPVIGGGVDREERERRRQAWLAEDEDVWTGGVQANPPLIGADAETTKVPEPAEPPIEIDLSSDRDVITELLQEMEGDDEPGEETVADTEAEITELRARLERLERQAAARRLEAKGDGAVRPPDWMPGDHG